jgi:plastocyanin
VVGQNLLGVSLRYQGYVTGLAAALMLAAATACGSTAPAADPAPPTTTMTMPPPVVAGVGPSRSAAAATVAVAIANFAFTPASLTVRVGTTVTWTNRDQEPHDVTDRAGAFRSPALNTGDTFHFTFVKPGQYSYLCTIHPFMTATVVVTP